MDIKREKKLCRFTVITIGVLFFATVAASIWNLFLYLFNSDKLRNHSVMTPSNVTLYFYKENALTTAFIVLAVLVLSMLTIIAVVLGLKRNQISQTKLPERRGALQVFRIFTGFALLAIPVLYSVFLILGYDLGKFQGTTNSIAIFLALPASLYFLFPGITDRFSEFLQSVFGICFIGFCIFSLITTHSYMLEGLTSPVRAGNLLSLVAMMLFMLYEVRFFASKALPNLYIWSAGCAVFFCAINGMPRLLLTTIINEMEFSLQTVYAVLEILISLYAAWRLVIFLSEWKYTLRVASIPADELPEILPVEEQSAAPMVEPDYTEDSEIESPILEAEIDLALFDSAFEANASQNDEALDAISDFAAIEEPSEEMIDESAEDTTEEAKEIDPLEALISEIADACEAEAKEMEEKAEADDKFDALSDAMFSGSKEN